MEDTVVQEEQTTEIQDVQQAEAELEEAQEELKEAQEQPKMYDEAFIKKLQDKVQKRIDKVVAEKHRYKKEAEDARAELQKYRDERPNRPNPKDFMNEYDELDQTKYNEAMVKYEDSLFDYNEKRKIKESSEKSVKEEMDQRVKDFYRRAKPVIEKYPDFHEIISQPVFSQELSDILLEYDDEDEAKGPELAVFLGKNPNEAKRISDIAHEDEFAAIKELGKLEGRLLSLSQKTSNAPEPINPVDDSRGKPEIDESRLSDEEWFIRAEKKRFDKIKKQNE